MNGGVSLSSSAKSEGISKFTWGTRRCEPARDDPELSMGFGGKAWDELRPLDFGRQLKGGGSGNSSYLEGVESLAKILLVSSASISKVKGGRDDELLMEPGYMRELRIGHIRA